MVSERAHMNSGHITTSLQGIVARNLLAGHQPHEYLTRSLFVVQTTARLARYSVTERNPLTKQVILG